MKSMVLQVTTIIIAVLVLASFATAGVPHMINYQGRLTDSTGAPLDTTVSMVFTIYDTPTGNPGIWYSGIQTVKVENGLFTYQLGSVNPLSDDIFTDTLRWLGIKVGTDLESTPRTRLISVPYAYRVSTVDGSSGGTISGDVAIQSDLDVDGEIHSSGTISSGNSITINGVLNSISSSSDKIYFTYDSLVDIGGIAIGLSQVSTHGIVILKTIDVAAPTQAKGVLAQISNPSSGITWGGDFKVNKSSEGTCFGVSGVVDLDGGVSGDVAYGAQGYATSNVDATGVWGYARVDTLGNGVASGGSFDVYNNGTGSAYAYGVYTNANSQVGTSYGGKFHAGPSDGTGTHYGVYASASGSGTTYAGYFVGDVSVIGEVGIGTANPQGALDVSSTTGALIVPRMTVAQRNALTAVNGMIIYNTTSNLFNFYENGAWVTK